MKQNFEIGKYGENKAAEYLVSNGYKIIGRNLANNFGEVDILCCSPDEILVFVEVKTMRQDNPAIAGLEPEDNITRAKLSKMKRFSEKYVSLNPELTGENGFRIDVIAVSVSAGKDPVIRHYENV